MLYAIVFMLVAFGVYCERDEETLRYWNKDCNSGIERWRPCRGRRDTRYNKDVRE